MINMYFTFTVKHHIRAVDGHVMHILTLNALKFFYFAENEYLAATARRKVIADEREALGVCNNNTRSRIQCRSLRL